MAEIKSSTPGQWKPTRAKKMPNGHDIEFPEQPVVFKWKTLYTIMAGIVVMAFLAGGAYWSIKTDLTMMKCNIRLLNNFMLYGERPREQCQ